MEKFNWFCGVCNSTAEENCSNFDDFKWDKQHTLNNACFVNLVLTLPHIFFLLFGSLVLFTLFACCGLWKRKSHFLIKQPGHNVRWILNFFLFNLTLIHFGEGVITDVDANRGFPTQPFMYVAPTLGLVATILTIVYYHHSEVWQKRWMNIVLLMYWLLGIGASALFFHQLHSADKDEGKDFLESVTTLRYDVALATMVLFSLYGILEMYTVRP